MKSKSPGGSREGIRAKVFWPAGVFLALVVAAFFLSRPRSSPPVTPNAEPPVANDISTGSQPARIVPVKEAHRLAQGPETEPETARLVSSMLDQSLSLQVRRQAARSLGKIGTDEAMAALRAALANNNPPYLKAAIAEGLGESPNPQARDLLHELVNGKDEITARGAARGLALQGDADAVNTLGNVLFNEQTALSVRTEAALALGDVDLAGAQDLLTQAMKKIQDEDIRESVLDGLGRRPFADTEPFFSNYLDSPDVPPDSKVLAIEAITDADGEVGPFLTKYLNDPNSDVRAAAKAALDFLGPEDAAAATNASK
jgi:HEAT repeat protein